VAQSYHAQGQFEGVVTVTRHGSLIYAESFGLADRLRDYPNTLDTPYRLCSITKQFTALLVMQLVEKGNIRLDGTIGNYLPGLFPAASRSITVRNLLTHTSGLANLDDVPGFYQNTDIRCTLPVFVIQTYLQSDLKTKPGEKFSYNNSDYIVLQAILEKQTGQAFEVLLKDRVLKPLGMTHSGLVVDEKYLTRQAIGYVQENGKPVVEPFYRVANFGAAGAMYSTARDMIRWNNALDSDTLLTKHYREIMFTADKSLGYVALGSWVYPASFAGRKVKPQLVERQGEIGGIRTLNLRVPEDAVSIVVLSNTDATDISATYLQKGLAFSLLKSLYAPESSPAKNSP